MEEFNELAHRLSTMFGEQIIVKNSEKYESSEYCFWNERKVAHPVQRKLMRGEVVLDYDGIDAAMHRHLVEYFKVLDLKFMAWQSSSSGVHVHMWFDIYGKARLKMLARIIADKVAAGLGIKCDLLPMGHGQIRAEYSRHPIKGSVKTLLCENLPLYDAVNRVPEHIAKLLPASDETESLAKSGLTGGEHCPKCIKFMRSNTFADGRERILFSLGSWNKASQMTDEQNFEDLVAWCSSQRYHISPSKIWATVRSSKGQVGCRYRHSILEDLGFDVKCRGKLDLPRSKTSSLEVVTKG